MIGQKTYLPNRGIGPMVFLGCVLAVMIAVLYVSSNLSEEKQPVPSTHHGYSTTLQVDSTPFDPKVSDWGALDDRTELGLQSTPVAAFKKAAEIVANRPWGRMRSAPNKAREGSFGFESFKADEVLTEPGAWRGAPVQCVGSLVEIEDLDLFDAYDMKLPDGRFKVRQGSMLVESGEKGRTIPVRFTLLDENAEGEYLFVPGQAVKLQAVFFKLQMLEGEKGPQKGLWLLGKRIFPSLRLPAASEIDLSQLAYVRDAETKADAKRVVFEEPPFFHLLSQVYHGFPVVESDVIPMRGKDTRKLLDTPADYRGKVMEIQGRVMKIEHYSLASWFPELSEDESEVFEFWNTYITSDGYVPLSIIWLNEPKLDLKTDNQVKIRAVFYRVWGYYAEDKATKAPMLIGLGTMVPVEIGEGDGFDAVSIGIAAFVALSLALVFFVLRYDRHRRQVFEGTRRARKQLLRGPLKAEESEVTLQDSAQGQDLSPKA